jgi:2-oxoisovalerate dehydrogenase E1 component
MDTDQKTIANIAFQVFLIREFEQTLLKLFADGSVHGPVHTSIGEEACAAGAMAALEPADKLASTHRAHHHYLAKLISYHAAKGFNILTDTVSDALQQEITHLMGEIMGLSIGCCGGRGGSMHLRNAQIGVIGTNAIVGGGIPLATGAAFAEKYRKSGNVVICFLGDGAVNQGSFHEALNLAGIWKLPIIYFVENNLYAVATATEKSTATRDIAVKAVAYGIKGMIVDGMDPIAVQEAVKQAKQHALVPRFWKRNATGICIMPVRRRGVDSATAVKRKKISGRRKIRSSLTRKCSWIRNCFLRSS